MPKARSELLSPMPDGKLTRRTKAGSAVIGSPSDTWQKDKEVPELTHDRSPLEVTCISHGLSIVIPEPLIVAEMNGSCIEA